MSSKGFNPNDLKIVINIVKRLKKRLYLLRTTLCDWERMENLKGEIGKSISNLEIDDEPELSRPTEIIGKEYKIVFDCCDIEDTLQKVLNELIQFGTFKSLFELVQEREDICEKFEDRLKTLDSKREEVVELKRQLRSLSEKSDSNALAEQNACVSLIRPTDSAENLSYVKQLLKQKVDSKKDYYEHLFEEANEKAKKFEREAEMQTHVDIQIFSVWLLKFEAQVVDLDKELRKAFDDWAMKKREIAVLKKYKRLNLEKMELVTKQISKREKVIETDKNEKEIKRQKAEEERKKYLAATLIQAHWRGTMVRKHLGPFKKLKKKKGKKGKKKNKK